MWPRQPEPPGQIPPQHPPTRTHPTRPIQRLDRPTALFEKATVALRRVERPLYSRPALLACRVGRGRRARTLRRDEYLALSAQIRAPNRELNATKFRHLAALQISTDVYFGDI